MNRLTDRPPLSQTDKLCLVALAGVVLTAALADWAMDAAACRSAELEDKPSVTLTWEAPIDQPRLLEAMALQLEPDPYREDVPLERELQTALYEACEASGVPVSLALGLIETESGFDPEIVSPKGAYGLCQLNPKYFPTNLSPSENIAAGIGWLGELLERHGDPAAALRAYNLGYDDGDRRFSDAVLAAEEKWRTT